MAFCIFSVWMKEISKTVGFETACFHLAKYYNLFFPFFSRGFEFFAAQSRFYINLYTNNTNERRKLEDFPYPLARYIRYFNFFFSLYVVNSQYCLNT